MRSRSKFRNEEKNTVDWRSKTNLVVRTQPAVRVYHVVLFLLEFRNIHSCQTLFDIHIWRNRVAVSRSLDSGKNHSFTSTLSFIDGRTEYVLTAKKTLQQYMDCHYDVGRRVDLRCVHKQYVKTHTHTH